MFLVLPDSTEIAQKQFYFISNVLDDRHKHTVVGAAQLYFGKSSRPTIFKWRNGIGYVSLVQYIRRITRIGSDFYPIQFVIRIIVNLF